MRVVESNHFSYFYIQIDHAEIKTIEGLFGKLEVCCYTLFNPKNYCHLSFKTKKAADKCFKKIQQKISEKAEKELETEFVELMGS